MFVQLMECSLDRNIVSQTPPDGCHSSYRRFHPAHGDVSHTFAIDAGVMLLYFDAGDDVVPFKFGEKSSKALTSVGFQDVTFKAYNGYVEKEIQFLFLILKI